MERPTVPTLLLWITVLFGLFAGAVLGVGVAAGATDTPTAGTNTTYVTQVDQALRVVDYELNDGQLHITFEADVPRRVSIVEAIDTRTTTGAGSFGVKVVNIPSGRSEVTFPAESVMVSTSQSVRQGRGTYIDATPSLDPTAGLTSNAALLTGAATGLTWVIAAGAISLRRERTVPKELSNGGHRPGESKFKKSLRGVIGWTRHQLAEHWILAVGLVGSVVVIYAATDASLPTVPLWARSVAVSTFLLGAPCYSAGIRIYRWFRDRRWYEVTVSNGLRGERRWWLVPPAVWREKTVEETPPNPIPNGCDYEVKTFEWHDGIEELTVEGTWPGEAKTGDLVTERTHFEEIHGVLTDAYRALKQLRARWSRMARQLEGEILSEEARANERGQMLDRTAAEDVWDEHAPDLAESPLEDEIPDLPSETAEQRRHDGPPAADPDDVAADGGEQ